MEQDARSTLTSRTVTIDGRRIRDIPSLYAEINRVFMVGVDWQLGPSLDALDDMLYGGYGVLNGSEPVTLIWLDLEKNRTDLGYEATRDYYLGKLSQPQYFDQDLFARKLEALEAGEGQTYMDVVLEIIAGHSNIELVESLPVGTDREDLS